MISAIIFCAFVVIIVVAQIFEFRSYYKKLNFNPLLPKRPAILKNRDIIDTNDNCIIVHSKTGKVIQIIKGKRSLYFHYLDVNTKNGKIYKNSLITDYTNIDEVKKYNSKDYRINYVSIKKAVFSCEKVQNIRTIRKIGVLILKLKNQDKFFYPISDLSKDKFKSIFEKSKSYEYKSDENLKRITIKEAILRLENPKIFYIILRTVTLLFGGSIFIFIPHTSFSVHRILVTAFIMCQFAMMILYCLYSDFSIRDLKKYETDKQNIYSKESNTGSFLFILSLVTLIIGINDNISEWRKYLVISLLVSAVLAGILILFADYNERKASILPAIMISLMFSFGTVGTFNYMYDISEPVISESEVYNKYKTTGKSTSYHLKVKLSNGKTESLSVSYDKYNSVDKGDTVTVYEYSGLFGIPYAEINTK